MTFETLTHKGPASKFDIGVLQELRFTSVREDQAYKEM